MRLIRISDAQGSGEDHVVLLFGAGLIGQAIVSALLTKRSTTSLTLPYSWHDAPARRDQKAALQSAIPQNLSRLSLVWAGGAGGFGSSAEDMAAETALLQEVCDFGDSLRAALPDVPYGLHLMSSAGGLFEGQTFCDADSVPNPLRPYGQAKLQQEHMAQALSPSAEVHIYRPSSVYGFARSGRIGLITALIQNTLSGKTTTIVGNPNTLRDYVRADDIGGLVAMKLHSAPVAGAAPQVHLLAHGRPASMLEVIGHVERALDRRMLLRFDPRPSNALDMSFRPSALPKGWSQMDLGSGIAHTVTQMRRVWAHA